MKIITNMKKAMRKRQRGATIVEMLVIIGIMGVITPALTLVITTLLASPQNAHANLTSTHDANYAGALITRDANCAEDWVDGYPDVTGNYGTFTWFELDGSQHDVLYHYSDGALMRQETIYDGVDVVVGPDTIIAQGLSGVGDVTFVYDNTLKFVTVNITVTQNDARGDPVTVERTFHAWMRSAVGADTWGLRRPINLTNGSGYNLTDYPMLLDLTGPFDDLASQYGLNWDVQAEIAAGNMMPNGDDIRFVRHVQVYELPLTISVPTDDHHVKVLIDSTDGIGDDNEDEAILGHMAPNDDGSDVRFFSERPLDAGGNIDKAAIYDPSDGRKLSFWVQERTDTSFIAWVNVPSSATSEIFMYYGDPSRESESSVADTFTSAQFTDPFADDSLIDGSESGHFIINASEEVEIDLIPGLVGNPSFEDNPNTSWTVTRTSNNLSYDLYNSGEWSSYGSHSAKFWKPNKWAWVLQNQYVQVSQTIDLTYVSGISFDTNMYQSNAGFYRADVWIGGYWADRWTQALPTTATDISGELTDLEDITGNQTLYIRVTSLAGLDLNQDFIAYFDEIRTTQFAEVTSDGFPDVAGEQFAIGDQVTWNDSTLPGTTDILYRVYGYDGSTWELIPDSLVPGNSDGFGQSPIDISGILPTSGYEKIRLLASMYSSDETVTPTLDDWTADYYTRNASVDPGTTYTTDSPVSTARFELLPFRLDPNDADESEGGGDIWDPAGGNVKLWVKISYIPIGDSKIYVYYGNPKAGTLPDGCLTDYEDAVGTYFHDPFDDWSLIDTDDTHHVTVNGGQVEVVVADDVVGNPSFETSDHWLFFDNDDDLKGEYSDEWSTKPTENPPSRSAHLFTESSDADGSDDQLMFVWQNHYAEVVQEVDLTDVHTLSFDYSLLSETDVFLVDYHTYQAQVRAGGQIIWSRNLVEGVVPDEDTASIDISGYGFEGVCTLSFRVQCTYARFLIFFPATTRHFDAYFDNIVTVGYQDGITVASVAFPEQGLNINDGFEVNWINDCPQGDIKYQIQYDANGDPENRDWQPLENSMFEGSNNNESGMYTHGGAPPVFFIPNKDWSDKTWLRIVAWIEVSDTGHYPTIQDWSVKFAPVATVPPHPNSAIGAPEDRSDELPISVYGEDHVVPAGTEEERKAVQLNCLPVFDYFMNVRVDDMPTTEYDLNAAAGLITFHEAPAAGVVVSVDYLYAI